ncbi:hypothetical protein J8273_6678 [Carpediemonas membranifera]|uniref:Nucleolar protein Dnt1-like N-terminal domain-containing protein n=1 Tax=Carpediemonas membranifera TaxID=201153 RepID=A0A8J6AR13_9EUKA|nr:hypothetical protein J8273_6678 [Carpediemonas membranifera]|eukprot:KAG9392086.1 hypothetical protein J8273_6678 [Carpediemonas membranifera]
MRLCVYIDGDYSYVSEIEPNATIREFTRAIEREMKAIFGSSVPISIAALQTAKTRCDVNPNYPVSSVFKENDFVFVLRAMTMTVDQRVEPIILEIPEPSIGIGMSTELSQFDAIADHSLRIVETTAQLTSPPIQPQPQPQQMPRPIPQPAPPFTTHQPSHLSNRRDPCQPHCSLTKFGFADDPCPNCGEMRPYLPIEGQNCTELCVIRAKHGTGYVRKMKSQGLDFCSICISRYRHRKYAHMQRHQCAECHRPWLILNEAGLCRTCHVKLAGRPSARKRKNFG